MCKRTYLFTYLFIYIFSILLFVNYPISVSAQNNCALQDYNQMDYFDSLSLIDFTLTHPESINCCFCLAQDGDYLWAGTSAGAVRWNMKENTYMVFKSYDEQNNQDLKKIKIDADSDGFQNERQKEELIKWLTNAVEEIIVLSPGCVWVDTYIGAMIINGDKKDVYTSVEEAIEAAYKSDLRLKLSKVATVDNKGDLWLLKRIKKDLKHHLLQYDGKTWQKDKLQGFLQSEYGINDVINDSDSNLWACNAGGIYLRKGSNWEPVLKEDFYQLRVSLSGTLWAFGSGKVARLKKLDWEVFEADGRYNDFLLLTKSLMRKKPVATETSDGKLWFDAFLVHTPSFICFDGKEFNQSALSPLSAMSNKVGQTYAASGEQLYYYDNGKWKELPKPPFGIFNAISQSGSGSRLRIIEDILVTDDGSVYVATNREGLLKYRDGKWEKITLDKNKEASSIAEKLPIKPLSKNESFLITGSGTVPKELIDQFYKSYIDTGGERLIKADDKDLADDVVNGKNETSTISYYRLLSRNPKLAAESLNKKIETLCSSDYGEGWITLEIASYGLSIVDNILKIAKDGTTHQRSIAIESLGLMNDSNAVDKLFSSLGNLKKLDSLSYLRLARAAITVGNPKGMELLIEPATGKKENDIQRTCRAELERMTERYDDLPSDWSAENWNEWWQKHKDKWKPEEAGQSQQLLLQSVKSRIKVYQEVAQRIEKELKKQKESAG